MFSHTQLEEMARMKHEELLVKAAWARKNAAPRSERTRHLPRVFQWLSEQGHKWFALRRPVAVEGIAASRQQAC